MTPKQRVLKKIPQAKAIWGPRGVTIHQPLPAGYALLNPGSTAVGWGINARMAWASADRALSHKASKKQKSINQRAARAIAEAKARGIHRRELAIRVGTFVLNEMEHGGQIYVEDYRTVSPGWVLHEAGFKKRER